MSSRFHCIQANVEISEIDEFGGSHSTVSKSEFYRRDIPLKFENWEDRTAKFKSTPDRKPLLVVEIETKCSLDEETQQRFDALMSSVTNLPRPNSGNPYNYTKEICYSVPGASNYVLVNTNPDGDLPYLMTQELYACCYGIGCVIPYLLCIDQFFERKKWVNVKYLHSEPLVRSEI